MTGWSRTAAQTAGVLAAFVLGSIAAAATLGVVAAPSGPALRAVTAGELRSVGILLEVAPPDPVLCAPITGLPGPAAGAVTGACGPRPSRTQAEEAVRGLGKQRIVQEAALADCSIPRAGVAHQLCWVMVMDRKTSSLPALDYLAGSSAGSRSTRGVVLDFVYARTNRPFLELHVAVGTRR